MGENIMIIPLMRINNTHWRTSPDISLLVQRVPVAEVPTRKTMEVTLVPLLVDWLTLGDLARLHEALCDREADVPFELRHVLRARLGLVHPPSSTHPFTRLLSSYMNRSKTRCRECGVHCRRLSRVCFECAGDVRSYRAMVARKDLRTTSDGFRIRERRLLQALSTIRVVTSTSTGAYLYWRRDALNALASHD